MIAFALYQLLLLLFEMMIDILPTLFDIYDNTDNLTNSIVKFLSVTYEYMFVHPLAHTVCYYLCLMSIIG